MTASSLTVTDLSKLTPADFETVVGVEVHVQLSTKSKLFCADPNVFGAEPNANTSPISLGYPGVLPVLNEQAVRMAIKLGLALNCKIADWCLFDRKHYFYPDLPKAYQISQYEYPICGPGLLELLSGKQVRIHRAHLEEDAGKLVHVGADGLAGSDYSLVDLNRAGTPLLEIVSEPDIRSGAEAREYMTLLRAIVRAIGVCDGNLEEGSMRCDANVSVRVRGTETLGTRAEVKNMNSFKAVEKAVDFEAQRQIALILKGEPIVQETRLWNDATQATISMRKKEGSADYRYFPDPDLRPLQIPAQWIETLRAEQPELPRARFERYTQALGLPPHEAGLLVENQELGLWLDTASEHCANTKGLANWLVGDITSWLKAEKKTLADTPLSPVRLAELVGLIDAKTISNAIAKEALPTLLTQDIAPKAWVEANGKTQVTDPEALKPLIQAVIDANPEQAAAYRGGKDKLLGFFVGQAMKATKGQANPELLNQLVKDLLG